MLRQERLDARAKRARGEVASGREGQEVVEIGCDSPLHTLHRAAVHHHGRDREAEVEGVFGFRESCEEK